MAQLIIRTQCPVSLIGFHMDSVLPDIQPDAPLYRESETVLIDTLHDELITGFHIGTDTLDFIPVVHIAF